MKRKYRWIITSLIIAIVTIVMVVIAGYVVILKPNFANRSEKQAYIYIRPGDNFDDVLKQIDTVMTVGNTTSFRLWANYQHLPEHLHTGRYLIPPSASNRQVVNMFSSGSQSPINITFNNLRLPQQLAARLATYTMLDSAQWMSAFTDSALLAPYNINTAKLFTLVLPNTYEVYWDITGEQFLSRMARFSTSFWNGKRRAQAAALGLTTDEVIILASVVEEETNKKDEKPMVAGLYLNRLQRGMLLQSDPTVKFAVGDFSLTQILNVHLAVSSPYNTYIHPGLPPGPIRMPSLDGIDAVLNAAHHNYIYMCAKPELNGYHNFAATLAEHNRNAAAYHRALRQWQAKQKQK
ncbi:MAG: endolytic transglycosylase MltG [Bacteroidales bacterium]|nr:endolytic transglycosylase MltG [Bacteroidales bacterium]